MKFTSAIVVLAGAVAVQAQGIADLPSCALSCSVQAAGAAMGCSSAADLACTCTAANQALVAAVLLPCLTSACSASDLQKAVTVGQAICAPYAAAPAASSAVSSAVSSATSMAASSAVAVSSAASSGVAMPTSSVPAATLVAVSSSTVLTTKVSTVTPSVAVTQISDGQPQAATSTKPVVVSSVSAQTTVVAYTGNGAMATAAPVALAGIAAVVAAIF